MSRTDPEILALRALGETAGSAGDAEHAGTCPYCRAELARLTELVRLARNEGAGECLETPPPQVWDRIAAANGTSAPVVPRIRPRRGLRPARPRGRLATGLAGLAAGLIIGIAGTAGAEARHRQHRAAVLTRCRPLPGGRLFG